MLLKDPHTPARARVSVPPTSPETSIGFDSNRGSANKQRTVKYLGKKLPTPHPSLLPLRSIPSAYLVIGNGKDTRPCNHPSAKTATTASFRRLHCARLPASHSARSHAHATRTLTAYDHAQTHAHTHIRTHAHTPISTPSYTCRTRHSRDYSVLPKPLFTRYVASCRYCSFVAFLFIFGCRRHVSIWPPR